MERGFARSKTSRVRPKICSERTTAFSLPLLLKKEERAGERRASYQFPSLRLSPRSFLAEREAKPRKPFACRRFALSAQPRFLSLSSSKRRRGPGRGGASYQFPLSPALSPLVPRGEREAKPQKPFACRTQLVGDRRSTPRHPAGGGDNMRPALFAGKGRLSDVCCIGFPHARCSAMFDCFRFPARVLLPDFVRNHPKERQTIITPGWCIRTKTSRGAR